MAAGFFALAVVVAVVAVLATRDKSGPVATRTRETSTPSVTAPATSAPDPQAATKAAVIAAYTQAYQAFIAVGKDAAPDVNDARLSQHRTGTALQAVQQALADNRSKGARLIGDAVLHPTVIQLGPDTATVVDCAYDQTALIDGRTGSTIIGQGPAQGGADTATLVLENGVWKVNHFKDEKTPCVPPAT